MDVWYGGVSVWVVECMGVWAWASCIFVNKLIWQVRVFTGRWIPGGGRVHEREREEEGTMPAALESVGCGGGGGGGGEKGF